jgi:hypothetical protein
LEVVVYISLLKNSGWTTEDFLPDPARKGCTELRASEKRSEKKMKNVVSTIFENVPKIFKH